MRDQNQWVLRLLCLVLIGGMGAAYQTQALAWQTMKKENQEQVAAAEAYNSQVLAEADKQEAQPEVTGSAGVSRRYQDGRFTGTGMGFDGEIQVTVELLEDEIVSISIDEASGEDTVYLSTAEAILEDILTAQSADVDTISGATLSSTGIREAVQDALEQAGVSE